MRNQLATLANVERFDSIIDVRIPLAFADKPINRKPLVYCWRAGRRWNTPVMLVSSQPLGQGSTFATSEQGNMASAISAFMSMANDADEKMTKVYR